MRVVGRVGKRQRVTSDDLQAAGREHLGERLDHQLRFRKSTEEGPHGRERERGVVGLMPSMQIEEDLLVDVVRDPDGHDLTPDRDTPRDHLVVHSWQQHGRTGIVRDLHQHRERLRLLGSKDDLRPGLDDARLLRSDLREGIAEVVGVVHADGRDHADVGSVHVGGVPATAHSGLDDRNVDRGVGEQRVAEPGDDLEHRHRWPTLGDRGRVHHLDEGLDLPVDVHEPLGRDRLTVDLDAFGEITQCRTGHEPGAKTHGPQQGLDDARDRGLTVGPRDVDDRRCELWGGHQVAQHLDACEIRRDLMLGPSGEQRALHGLELRCLMVLGHRFRLRRPRSRVSRA